MTALADRVTEDPPRGAGLRAGYGPSVGLSVAATLGCALLLASVAMLLIHPDVTGLGAFAGVVNQQNQAAKTLVYVATFALILPLALIFVPRLADRIAGGPNGDGLPALAIAVGVGLALAICFVRLSAHLPWGGGLGVLLAAVLAWGVLTALSVARAAAPRRWPALAQLQSRLSPGRAVAVTIASLLVMVLCVTHVRSLNAAVVVLGVLVSVVVVWAYGRSTPAKPPRAVGLAIDAVLIVLLLLAVPDTVIFRTSAALPNSFVEPGIIQFQQDWILGPANQLLGGGALLVNVPVSQYGVGMLYLLWGWFHIAPIGYGTFGLLDGILTALFYAAGYSALRLAGVSRTIAASALGLALAVLVYNLRYPVGALPEQGPLRFGLPIALVLALVAAERWPARARPARAAALVVLGIAAVWALEGFAYTLLTFAAMTAATAALRPPGSRRRFVAHQAIAASCAIVAAHVVLAVATVIATGQLPVWGRYFAFLHALLLGGKEGSITYGFDHFSPAIAVGGACVVSAAAIVLLIVRAPAVARRARLLTVTIAGTTAYSIALYSYADNRSSTYLLLYIALPLILTAALWLGLATTLRDTLPASIARGTLALGLSVAVILIAAAWGAIGGHFSRSALAHAYPGGGLRAAIHRLWHPPPIDPRAPDGERLLARYMPQSHPVVILPDAQDLAIEILMRSHRSNGLFIGDGYMDSFVPSEWEPVVARQIARLRPGQRVLVDRTALALVPVLRADRSLDPVAHRIGSGAGQEEWILQRLSRRFVLRPVAQNEAGLVVAQLEPISS